MPQFISSKDNERVFVVHLIRTAITSQTQRSNTPTADMKMITLIY